MVQFKITLPLFSSTSYITSKIPNKNCHCDKAWSFIGQMLGNKIQVCHHQEITFYT